MLEKKLLHGEARDVRGIAFPQISDHVRLVNR